MWTCARVVGHTGKHTFIGVAMCVSAFAREKRRVTSHRRSSNEACQCGESGS